jgi:hypothetical protein
MGWFTVMKFGEFHQNFSKFLSNLHYERKKKSKKTQIFCHNNMKINPQKKCWFYSLEFFFSKEKNCGENILKKIKIYFSTWNLQNENTYPDT